jgi:hypothetical protein
MKEIVLALLLVTNVNGESDLIIPVPDEVFTSAAACKTRRMALEAMHPLKPNTLALCLEADTLAGFPQN